MLFADGEEPLLALHHVHKAHRHTDDQRGPQAAFDLFCNRQQSRGRVADGEDGPGMLLRCLFHRCDGPGGASLFCGGGHLGVSHITADRAAQLRQTGFGDAGQRHIRIGHDDGPGVEGLDGLLHRAGGKFIKKPEGMRFLYSRMCRKFPNTVKALDNRHIMYGKCQQQLYNLEKEGKAFIFAPSNPPKMSTYTMDREVEQQLYDLGMKDFHDAEDRFKKFLI